MSAEAAATEDRLSGELEQNIKNVRAATQDHTRKFLMNDGWDIIKQIMRNRGIELDNKSQAMVIRSIYSASL